MLVDSLEFNWQSATTKALGWEALKAVTSGACMGVTYGVRCQLEATLGLQERRLAVLRGSGETLQEVREEMLQVQREVQLARDSLNRCTLRQYRLRLPREGDKSGKLLAWILRWDQELPPIL
ncbi:hypothetical protein NDU88_003695 [Pleurodeles waltl]|uniref:Uncharacterized protein n=1 Tax=Pleurodeles waltl TaxID=8319 RepID=A0AAV7WS17_PLEWA|nr:hypothetical protein NDU88_003695 [Pleurodeles waltl]